MRHFLSPIRLPQTPKKLTAEAKINTTNKNFSQTRDFPDSRREGKESGIFKKILSRAPEIPRKIPDKKIQNTKNVKYHCKHLEHIYFSFFVGACFRKKICAEKTSFPQSCRYHYLLLKNEVLVHVTCYFYFLLPSPLPSRLKNPHFYAFPVFLKAGSGGRQRKPGKKKKNLTTPQYHTKNI